MNDLQQQEFDEKLDARMARGFLYCGKNALINYRKYLVAYIDGFNAGRVSDSVFDIVLDAMVDRGELRPIVVEEESELTLEQYRSMPIRQIQLKYKNDPVFKAGVESLIARGLI